MFRKNEKEILARIKVGNHAHDKGNELVTRDEGSMKKNATNKKLERNNYSISFANLATIENSVVLVNSENANISTMPLNNKVDDEGFTSNLKPKKQSSLKSVILEKKMMNSYKISILSSHSQAL